MTKEEAITLLCEHFSEGMVRTIVDALVEDEREACAKLCDVLAVHPEYASSITKLAAQAIRNRGQV